MFLNTPATDMSLLDTQTALTVARRGELTMSALDTLDQVSMMFASMGEYSSECLRMCVRKDKLLWEISAKEAFCKCKAAKKFHIFMFFWMYFILNFSFLVKKPFPLIYFFEEYLPMFAR